MGECDAENTYLSSIGHGVGSVIGFLVFTTPGLTPAMLEGIFTLPLIPMWVAG